MAMMQFAEWMLERNRAPDAIVRAGVRRLLAQRLEQESGPTIEEEIVRKMERICALKEKPVAVMQEKANEQHYELPTELFLHTLGARRKYSSCYFETPDTTLDVAEDAMLRLYCQRASLNDGMSVLDLGCGWGSLTLYIAQHYPRCKVTAVSNSWTQRHFIEGEASRLGFADRIVVRTGDVRNATTLEGAGPFDRVFSIEMFEHMKNYSVLLERVARVMRPNSRLFVHYFCHRDFVYEFETEGASNWMGRHFFSGGTMPCDDLLAHFQDHVKVVDRWRVDGRHYAQTSECWLDNFDRNIDQIRPILAAAYGEDATKWEAYWRTFYIAVAELFGYRGGQEWYVAHYLFEKR